LIPVAFDLRDPVRSGIARVARSLARSFAEQSQGRFRITLAGPRDRLQQLGAGEWSRDIASIVDWQGGRYSPRAQRDWKRVRRAVGDAVWYFPHWDIPLHAVPQQSIVTLHDLGHLRREVVPWHRGFIARRWMRHAVTRAARVTTATDFTRREITTQWPQVSNKIEVIPHGVDPFFFAPSILPVDLKTVVAQGPFMLSVGNLKRHKNLAIGPEVLARLPNMRWIVVGEWFSDWQPVERRAESLGVRGRIAYLGEQSDEAVNGLYHHAACLFFPSRHEGFGLPILEALAAGTPVVAGDYGTTREILGDAGWTCDPDAPGEFAAAVTAALSVGPVARERGRARAMQFSWSNSAARLASTIEDLNAA
jgi:glycosyltransferase involved in cell wall biosynthesis